jgi:hypothetical protein
MLTSPPFIGKSRGSPRSRSGVTHASLSTTARIENDYSNITPEKWIFFITKPRKSSPTVTSTIHEMGPCISIYKDTNIHTHTHTLYEYYVSYNPKI